MEGLPKADRPVQRKVGFAEDVEVRVETQGKEWREYRTPQTYLCCGGVGNHRFSKCVALQVSFSRRKRGLQCQHVREGRVAPPWARCREVYQWSEQEAPHWATSNCTWSWKHAPKIFKLWSDHLGAGSLPWFVEATDDE